MSDSKVVSVVLRTDIWQELENYRWDHHMSMTELVRRILAEWVETHV